ncbi:MAG TPA: cytidylate kinase-like family protein [Candidatus Ventricola gallistercoris]|nr:cytidylate kinase-like family protein [Candidatus Ventricola gallistercoris]
MNNRVITIARSYGSGGRKMGRLLAKELGYEYYDREILRIASDESGISEELFSQVDEVKRVPLLRIAREVYTGEVIPPDSDDFISNENLFRYQAKIIRELAATRNCVIVGRCANFILRGWENVLNVFVTAPVVDCVRRVMETDGLSLEDAEKRIKKIDKRRAEYFKYFTGRLWHDAALYDLCLNTGHMDEHKCVQIVRAYMDARFDDD